MPLASRSADRPEFLLTAEQCRRVDRRAIEHYGLAGIVLMENAGRGIVDQIERCGLVGPALICCGKGNNAGDGFVIARHLLLRGQPAQIALWSTPTELRGDAAVNFAIAKKLDIAIEVFGDAHNAPRLAALLKRSSYVVDALLGTGAKGAPRAPFAAVIEQLNASGRPIVAVDLPSGLDGDTGAASAATIRAAHTLTLLAAKPGLRQSQAAPFVGRLAVCDIGVPPAVIAEVLREE